MKVSEGIKVLYESLDIINYTDWEVGFIRSMNRNLNTGGMFTSKMVETIGDLIFRYDLANRKLFSHSDSLPNIKERVQPPYLTKDEEIYLRLDSENTIKDFFSHHQVSFEGIKINFNDIGLQKSSDRKEACTEYCWLTKSQDYWTLSKERVSDIVDYLFKFHKNIKDMTSKIEHPINNKPYCIIFEGEDGTGKTTQAQLLSERFGFKYFRQPNNEGPLGFIRDIVKTSKDYDMFTRQLMHSVSHIVDAYEYFSKGESCVMDRSPLSAIAYSLAQGLGERELNIIENINLSVYSNFLRNYNVEILFFEGKKYKMKVDENDIYENDKTISKNIKGIYKSIRENVKAYFNPSERRHLINCSGTESIDYVHKVIVNTIFNN